MQESENIKAEPKIIPTDKTYESAFEYRMEAGPDSVKVHDSSAPYTREDVNKELEAMTQELLSQYYQATGENDKGNQK